MSILPRENVLDYPRPPRLEPVPQRILIRLDGEVIAETTRTPRVLETHHPPTFYLPPADVFVPLERAAWGQPVQMERQGHLFRCQRPQSHFA